MHGLQQRRSVVLLLCYAGRQLLIMLLHTESRLKDRQLMLKDQQLRCKVRHTARLAALAGCRNIGPTFALLFR